MIDLKIWFLETRPPFLLLSVVLVFLGTSLAVYQGFFNPIYFVLVLAGMIPLHVSVNVLNDYFDYKSGIDLATKRTPFSGGSGILPAHLLKPSSVYRFGVACLLIGLLVGSFFVVIRPWLFPLVLVGALTVYFYTTHLAKYMIGELFAGLGLGALPVLGAYFVQTGIYTLPALATSIPPLILTHNLLFLNEFPDADADSRFGRRNLVIALGKEKASKLYTALTIAQYLWIVASVAAGIMPLPCLISLLNIPVAAKAIKGALKHHSNEGIVQAQGANVATVLSTQALLGIGFLAAGFLRF